MLVLQCDKCQATYTGDPYWKRGHNSAGGGALLRQEARAIGWTGPLTRESNTDRCPDCSAAEKKAA